MHPNSHSRTRTHTYATLPQPQLFNCCDLIRIMLAEFFPYSIQIEMKFKDKNLKIN